VRFVLGTPLVTDIFHADRWDYVFFRELADGKKEQRNLTVVFENEKLSRIIGDLLPAPGSAPQAGGFESQKRNDTAPRSIGKPAAKPPADAAEAKPDVAKPDAPAPEAATAAEPAPAPATGQNWGTASEAPAAKAEEKPAAKPEANAAAKADEKPAAESTEQKAAGDEPKEKGFFGRMLEKIGL